MCAPVRGVKAITNQTYKELILHSGQGARSGWGAAPHTEEACNPGGADGGSEVRRECRLGVFLDRWNNGGSYQGEREIKADLKREREREREAGVVARSL